MSLASIEQDGEEMYDAANLGTADSVQEERFADDECILIKGGAKHTQSSIVLRGANSFMLDEMERSMNDALQVQPCTPPNHLCTAAGCRSPLFFPQPYRMIPDHNILPNIPPQQHAVSRNAMLQQEAELHCHTNKSFYSTFLWLSNDSTTKDETATDATIKGFYIR